MNTTKDPFAPKPVKVILTVGYRTIYLSLKEDKGEVGTNKGEVGTDNPNKCVYHFNQKDKISDIVSDINLFFLTDSQTGNILFRIIEDWLED